MRLRRIALAPRLDQVAILRQIIGHVGGEPVYAICGADGEGSGSGDGGNKDGDAGKGGSGSGGTGDDDDDDDDGSDDGDDTPPKDPKEYKAWAKTRELAKENAKRRVAARKAREERDAALAELEQFKQKDMSELQKAQSAAAKAEKAVEDLTAKSEKMQVELAFLKMPRDKYDWEDTGVALTLLMTEFGGELHLEDDGSVAGLDQAVKDMAKKHKFLLKQPAGAGKNGSTGGNFSGDEGKGGNKQEEALKRFRI
jgi:hypothetical protein